MKGLAVVNSDFSTMSLSILDTTGALVRADCVDSATGANGSVTSTISGDAVLPSQPQLGGAARNREGHIIESAYAVRVGL